MCMNEENIRNYISGNLHLLDGIDVDLIISEISMDNEAKLETIWFYTKLKRYNDHGKEVLVRNVKTQIGSIGTIKPEYLSKISREELDQHIECLYNNSSLALEIFDKINEEYRRYDNVLADKINVYGKSGGYWGFDPDDLTPSMIFKPAYDNEYYTDALIDLATKHIYNSLNDMDYNSFNSMCESIKECMNDFNNSFGVDDTYDEMISNGLIEVHPRFNSFCDDCDDIVNSFEDVNRLIEQFWSSL